MKRRITQIQLQDIGINQENQPQDIYRHEADISQDKQSTSNREILPNVSPTQSNIARSVGSNSTREAQASQSDHDHANALLWNQI